MGLLTSNFPTLVDKLSKETSNGKTLKIIEQMAKNNSILSDAEYAECNDGSKHKTSIRAGISEPAFRLYNQGVQPSVNKTVQVTDTTAMMEDYGVVDKALADLHGNADDFRAGENLGKLQGFNNKAARYMIYGNTDVEPEGFMGLSPRYSDLNGPNKENIIDCGGTGVTNTSIWFVTWGEGATQLIYPKGSVAGFQHRFLGECTHEMGDGKLMQAYRDHFKWDIGMSVRDWRTNARLCNIDVTALTKDASSGTDLIDRMIEGYYALENEMQGEGRVVIYANKTIQTYLHKQAMNAKNVNLTIGEYAGKKIPEFLGVPVKRLDAILNTEARVVGL